MESQTVVKVPLRDVAGLDQAFLSPAQWDGVPNIHLVRAENGDAVVHPTSVQVAWSTRGIHLAFRCDSPGFAESPPAEWDAYVGVFLDPVGERSQYMTIFANPFGQVRDARVEDPLHQRIHSEIDESWNCPGVRVRNWSRQAQWSVELVIPFDGITPVIDVPAPGDRWTGNFYRVQRHPLPEISAWCPVFSEPPDLYDSDYFGILELVGSAYDRCVTFGIQ